jgi:hypothetical protein
MFQNSTPQQHSPATSHLHCMGGKTPRHLNNIKAKRRAVRTIWRQNAAPFEEYGSKTPFEQYPGKTARRLNKMEAKSCAI